MGAQGNKPRVKSFNTAGEQLQMIKVNDSRPINSPEFSYETKIKAQKMY